MIFGNKYEQKKLIGKGGIGVVYKVLDNKNNKFYALKFISNIKNVKKFKEEYEKHIRIMKNIKNKYIIELKDNFYDEINKGYCILMELYDENLRQILNRIKPNRIPLNIINKIFIQLNEALKTMRLKNISHRNIKPENILIKYTSTNKIKFDIKLTDFEFLTNEINSFINIKGIKYYKAPELKSNNYNDKNDLWSLGILLYLILILF